MARRIAALSTIVALALCALGSTAQAKSNVILLPTSITEFTPHGLLSCTITTTTEGTDKSGNQVSVTRSVTLPGPCWLYTP